MRLKIFTLFLFLISLQAKVWSADKSPFYPEKVAWGAAIDAQADMSGQDMSSIGIEAYFGMKTPALQILGVGAAVNVPVSSSLRSMPVFAVVRTNFSTRPTLCFLELRGGCSFNEISENLTQTGAYASAGIGFNLAFSKKFSSHLIIAYSFYERHDEIANDVCDKYPSLHFATIRLGVTF